jgi:hypothetical protein
MKVRINKNCHLASNQFTGLRLNLFGTGTMAAMISFGKDAIYETKDVVNQDDWNKLFGASWGLFPLAKQFQMKINSSRWSWRWKPELECFQVAPYVHQNGMTIWAELGNFPIINLKVDEKIFLIVNPQQDKQIVNFRYSKSIRSSFLHTYPVIDDFQTFSFSQSIPSLAGFSAPGYFGGDEKAPKQIIYSFEKVNAWIG